MRTRRGLLGILVASAFTAALGGTVALTAGCGGGTPQNTIFGGSYGAGEWIVNGPSNASAFSTTKGTAQGRNLTFTVNQKGRILGTFVSDTGVSYDMDGTVDNSGKFDLTLTAGSAQYKVKGILAHQKVPQPSLSGGADTFADGVAGNFRETINGTDYDGIFYGSGGNTTTTGG